MTAAGGRASPSRVVVTIVLQLLAFTITFVASFVFVFLSKHSRGIGEKASAFLPALVLATVAIVIAGLLLEQWTFGPRASRSGVGRQPIVTRAVTAVAAAAFLAVWIVFPLRAAWSAPADPGPDTMRDTAEWFGGQWVLARIARDHDAPVMKRLRAAAELASDDRPVADDDLIAQALASDDEAVRCEIARAVPCNGFHRAAYLRLLDDRAEAVVGCALEVCVNSQDAVYDAVAVDRIEALIEHGPPPLRAQAFERYRPAAGVPQERKRQFLRRLLAGTDDTFKFDAAADLLRSGDPSGFESALRIVRAQVHAGTLPSDQFVRSIDIVAEFHDERAAPMLWTLAHCARLTDEERKDALEALDVLFTGPGVGRMPQVPARYAATDIRRAPSRPSWSPDVCPN